MHQKGALKTDDFVIQRKDVVCRFLDNNAILLSPESRHPIRLNEVGKKIWELMEHRISVDDLIDDVHEFYQMDKDVISADTIDFLSDLLRRNLIKTA